MLVVSYHVTGQLLSGDPVIVGHMTHMIGGGGGVFTLPLFSRCSLQRLLFRSVYHCCNWTH